MAAARPIVATRVGGNSEAVKDGVTGTLVPASDAPALAHAIMSMLEDPASARRMGEAGRERAMRCFSLDTMRTQYQAVYKEAIVTP
jgi:glycosyltransferase involved in cell wall biosynthesis